jgi:hypothetical protein
VDSTSDGTRPPSNGEDPGSDKGQRHAGTEPRNLTTEELVNRYSEGESIRELASSMGRSYGFVHRALTEAGVPLRPRGGSRRRRRPPHEPRPETATAHYGGDSSPVATDV